MNTVNFNYGFHNLSFSLHYLHSWAQSKAPFFFNLFLLMFDLISTETDHFLPIHREAPSFVEQATEQQILVTGIKVSCISFYNLLI